MYNFNTLQAGINKMFNPNTQQQFSTPVWSPPSMPNQNVVPQPGQIWGGTANQYLTTPPTLPTFGTAPGTMAPTSGSYNPWGQLNPSIANPTSMFWQNRLSAGMGMPLNLQQQNTPYTMPSINYIPSHQWGR